MSVRKLRWIYSFIVLQGKIKNQYNELMEKIAKIGKVSSQSVFKCTGKNWDEWIKILNNQGAKAWSHKDIVKVLKTKYKLSLWWQQGVASAYEVHIGRRTEGQNQKGEYSTVATKTYSLSVKTLWTFLVSPEGIRVWLDPLSDFKIGVGNQYEVYGGIFGEVRTLKPFRRIRLTWQEVDWAKPSIIQITMVPRPQKKAILVIQHDSLKNEKGKAKMLKIWKAALTKIQERLDSKG